jgi:hypothetical protein
MKKLTICIAIAVMCVTAWALDRTPAVMVKTSIANYSWLLGTNVQEDLDMIDNWIPDANAYMLVISNLARQAYNNSLTNVLDIAATLEVSTLIQTNIDAKLAYMGYPRIGNKAITKSAGAGSHPSTYTRMTDTNLVTYTNGTINAGTSALYFMDLAEVYDGVVVAVVSGDNIDTDTSTLLYGEVMASTAYPLISDGAAGAINGAAKGMNPAVKANLGTLLGTNGIQSLVQPFHGRYVGVQFYANGVDNHTYRVYEIVVYGVTNAWRNW